MAVKKAKDASFKRMDSAYASSKSAIKKIKNADPLNAKEEQEQEEGNASVDPANYLSKKEKKEWKRLSYTAKQRYIRQAERQLKRQKKRNGIARTEQSSVQEKEQQAAEIFLKERKYKSNTWKEPLDKKEIGSHDGNGEIASKSGDSRAAIRSQSTVVGGEKTADIASSASAETTKAAGSAAAKTADTAAASTGAGLAALVAKKTAENFKEMLQQKNKAIESQRIKTQTKLSQLIEENKTGAGSPSVAAVAMLASVVVTVMYFAVQIAVTIFFVLLILLIPIIVIVSFLGIIITLLSGFAAAVDNTDYASGSGASIVAVAVQEIGYHEGAGNHTKYGVYTGTDGMSWCHAFVSWCANECGFIESNIIPKTAACETGRQWFIHKQQYQKAGSYTPQAGDIIYFDKGGVGESHHVGIVEYVENGIVHTIEGNKNSQVMRGHYELTYKGIMGYGTPDYPDEGLTSSTASEILSKAQELGKMIKKIKIFYQAGHYLEEKNPYAVNQKDVRKNAIRINELYEECKYILNNEIKTEGELLEKQSMLVVKEKELMKRRSSLRSLEDKEMLNEGEERRRINAKLREIRHEKRIVNRIVEEEKNLNKEQKILKERTEIRHRR